MKKEQDEKYMQQCIKLASIGFGQVAPNPMVGCVVVAGGKIIGKGYHEKYGDPHAEVQAINSVKNKSQLQGASLYVSLEPCSHHGKTPPCTNVIIKSGISRVVVGAKDTNAEVSGGGKAKLEEAGIDVVIGVLEKECREQNKRFLNGN